jgi:hypothetical protein
MLYIRSWKFKLSPLPKRKNSVEVSQYSVPPFLQSQTYLHLTLEEVTLGQVFVPSFSVFPISIIPSWLSILMYHLRCEQYAHWWPQFRDIILLHQH